MEKDSSLRGRGDKIFQVVCYIVLTILALSAVLPFLMLLLIKSTLCPPGR